MKLSQQSLSTIESAIQKAVAKYVCSCEQTVVTDIHLQPDQASGQLNIYNDDDEELANIMIEEWATYEGDDFLENVEPSLRNILCRMKDAGDFDKVTILKPYSFVLVDEEKETVCRIAKEAGVDFVKTSTGFGTAGATVHDVALMRRVVGPTIGVKAAGGIRDLDSALALIQAGATRLGTSSGIQIVESYKELKKGL